MTQAIVSQYEPKPSPDNLRAKFHRGQTVWIVVKIDGVPKILEKSVIKASSDHLKITGGNPESWARDYRTAAWCDRNGIHKQIAHEWVHLDYAGARRQLIYEIKELQMELRQRELTLIESALKEEDTDGEAN